MKFFTRPFFRSFFIQLLAISCLLIFSGLASAIHELIFFGILVLTFICTGWAQKKYALATWNFFQKYSQDTRKIFLMLIGSLAIYFLSTALFQNFLLTWKPYSFLRGISLIGIVIFGFLLSRCTPKVTTKMSLGIFTLVFLVLLSFSSFERLHNLGSISLHHDEYWLAATTQSYHHTNQTTLWNYVTQKPTDQEYSLRFFTVSIGEVTKHLGYNETTLRILPALFGILATAAITGLGYLATRSRSTALISMFLLTFSTSSIYLSRYLRQYSLLQLLSILLCSFLLLSHTFIKKSLLFYGFLASAVALWLFLFFEVSPFSLAFLPVLGLSVLYLFWLRRKYAKESLWILSLLILIPGMTVLLEFLGVISFFDFPSILERNFILGFNMYRANDYFRWTFNQTNLPHLLLGLFTLAGTLTIAYKKRFPGIVISAFFWTPFFLLIINQYHSHDFRYVHYILPFAFIILAFFTTEILSQFKLPHQLGDRVAKTLFIITLFGFSLPFIQSNAVIKQSLSSGSLSEYERLHRRAVPPDYFSAFAALHSLQKSGDAVIVIDGNPYIQPNQGVEYYKFVARNNTTLLNLRTNERTTLEEILTSYQNIYLIGAFIHLDDQESTRYIINTCESLGKELNLPHFNYEPYYENKPQLTWPSLFRCSGYNERRDL